MIMSGERQDHRSRVLLMAAIAVASVAMWQTALGSMVLYPFTILATWFHEMGHGVAAMLTGATFDHLVINADGSGVTHSMRSGGASRTLEAVTSAAGPVGPAIAGSWLIASSRTPRTSGRALTILGVAILVSTAIWVRSVVGWVVLPPIGLAALWIAGRGTPAATRFAVQLLGVQASISVWEQFDYVFSSGGSIDGQPMRSDTGAMADALLLPYWFWGGVVSVAILGLMWLGFRTAFRR
jgi:hypothetical protein